MISKEQWTSKIQETTFEEFYTLFKQLNYLNRFKFHNCSDSVLKHTCRMLNIHIKLLKGRVNDLEYFTILFHDFEEIFTGDIPTPTKSPDDKENEKKVLIKIYRKIQSLKEEEEEEEFKVLKLNMKKIFQIGQRENIIKNHIKVIDTFDAMMFSFHMITLGKKSFLAPFLFYINPKKEKSFVNFLKESNSKKHSFFGIERWFLPSTKPYHYYYDIYESILRHSFDERDIKMMLEYEEEIIKLRSNSNQEIGPVDIENNLNIKNFENKLNILISIFRDNPHYKEWLKIYTFTSIISEEEFNASLLYLKNNLI